MIDVIIAKTAVGEVGGKGTRPPPTTRVGINNHLYLHFGKNWVRRIMLVKISPSPFSRAKGYQSWEIPCGLYAWKKHFTFPCNIAGPVPDGILHTYVRSKADHPL